MKPSDAAGRPNLWQGLNCNSIHTAVLLLPVCFTLGS
jgi:hypothetical protein